MRFLDNPTGALRAVSIASGIIPDGPGRSADKAGPGTGASRNRGEAALAGRAGVKAQATQDASWRSEQEAAFWARIQEYSADPEKCSNGWYRLLAETIAYAHAKAVCEDEFGGELVKFEFDDETCQITACKCRVADWRPPGGIPKPSPIPWGPDFWEEDHWEGEW